MKNLAAFPEEGIDISPGIHRSCQDFRMLVGRLRFSN